MPQRTSPHNHSHTAAKTQDNWEALTLSQLEERLECTPDGLTSAEATQRLNQNGYNELAEVESSVLLKFLSYFWGPIPWMIEIAAILSAVVQHWADFGIILTLLIVNAVIGFWEEFQAGNAIAALKSKLALGARVKRDGKWQQVPARELVPGDRIRIRLGDITPADARLLEGDPIEVDQSALTGESLPVTRNANDSIYSGSIVRQGETDALVYGTGANTFFGRTANLVQGTNTTSHFQKAVLKIGDFLIVIAVVLVVLILIVAMFRGDAITTSLQFALVLSVAAIPVAMPTVLSVTMAVGARLLAKGETIVSRMAAIEELAGMDVLCSDKTGTLTKNSLTLGEPFLLDGVTKAEILRAAALASRAEDQDAIDLAVLAGAKEAVDGELPTVEHYQPFDPVNKRTEALYHAADGTDCRASKGAPQVILALAPNADEIQAAFDEAIDGFARRGFRSLGVAKTDASGQWQVLGVLPLFDPPRDDSATTIAQAKEMGCDVKMVTGDQVAIGREIAGQLNIGNNLIDAKIFQNVDYHNSARIDQMIEDADGFAQVYPEHKYHIVDVLQKHGHIVGMTGDGVNDAPALKKADCGIAVSGATDAARAAADIVLLSPGLSVVIDAIREARKIFQRMNSYAIYRIAETVRVLLFMTLSILVFNFYPVTAVMIVLLALLNDGAILSIAYDRVHYSDRPEKWNMPLVLGISSVLGLAGVVASFGLFYLAERVFHLEADTIQSLIYLKLSVAGQMTIFATRTRGPFWSIAPAKPLLLAVLGAQTVATLVATLGIFMTPIGWKMAGLVWLYALAWFLVNDRLKLIAYRIFDPNEDPWLDKAGTPLHRLMERFRR
ncbi:plasma-membrane proton-efflux P-type ATPase [Blastopirellula marina]|uniref:Plasma-membrane proton-efflux P-type ATPase n=1 Tax=Blastopirellula marina TaxID=124 RepID=A0A2S8GPR2_9BACT|nr:plasma-membrane proton-efflux P-type ATPase [Blastopirellula marina]PQO46417.1 plasma-membrane proton-efflux P-type ATPase [Blastopirellula marina]